MAKLIVINGVPGVGKTTLSRRLNKELPDVVLLNKDTLKEFLFDSLPPGDFEWSKLLGRVSIEALYAMTRVFLKNDRDVILENAFYKEFATRDLPSFDVPLLEIYCRCEEETRRKRYIDRANTTRHPGHMDKEGVNLDPLTYSPLQISEMIYVDTTYEVSDAEVKGLAAKMCRFLQEKTPSKVT
jgi:predicted kinase